MTHIDGKVEWWRAVFERYLSENGILILTLNDGKYRTMSDWGEDSKITKLKLESLKKGDLINVATWGGWSKEKWFCDVEKINF